MKSQLIKDLINNNYNNVDVRIKDEDDYIKICFFEHDESSSFYNEESYELYDNELKYVTGESWNNITDLDFFNKMVDAFSDKAELMHKITTTGFVTGGECALLFLSVDISKETFKFKYWDDVFKMFKTVDVRFNYDDLFILNTSIDETIAEYQIQMDNDDLIASTIAAIEFDIKILNLYKHQFKVYFEWCDI